MIALTLALGYINVTHSNYHHHYTTVHERDSGKGGLVSMVLRILSDQKRMEENRVFRPGGTRHSTLLCERLSGDLRSHVSKVNAFHWLLPHSIR